MIAPDSEHDMGVFSVRFSWIALAVILASALANAWQAVTASQLPVLLAVNLVCLVLLTASAVRMHKQRAAGFDPVVASETIVAFGVTSLIFSLVAALTPMMATGAVENLMKGGGVLRLAMPFLEGLATAGAAPLFAMLVRNLVAEQAEEGDEIAETGDLAAAVGALTKQLSVAHKAVDELSKPLTTAAKATRTLAETVEGENDRLRTGLGATADRIKALGEAADESRGHLAELAAETVRLKAAAAHEADRLRVAAAEQAEHVSAAAAGEAERLRIAVSEETERLRQAVAEQAVLIRETLGAETQAVKQALSAEAERIRETSEAAIQRVASAAEQEAGRIRHSAADETARLKVAAEEAAVLLETLSKLIVSVERFVTPSSRVQE